MANRDRAVKMAARGATPQQIRQTTGVSGQAARNIVGRATAAAAAPAATTATTPTTTPTSKRPATLGQGLRIAGTGGITSKEFNKIARTTDLSPEKIIQKLDEVNKNLRAKDKTGIDLNSGVTNMLIRKQRKAGSKPTFENYLASISGPRFGKGAIGRQLEARLNATDLQGMKGNFMLGGTAIRPGGRETVRGFGKQYQYGGGAMPTAADTTAGGAGAGTGAGAGGEGMLPQEPIMPMLPETPETPDTQVPFGVGADLANWATGYKSKQSSRKRGGAKTRTLSGSTRIMPTSTTLGLQ